MTLKEARMQASNLPGRQQRTLLIVAVIVLAIIVIGALVSRAGQRSPQASGDDALPQLDSGETFNPTQQITLKVVDKDGNPKVAFLDIYTDDDNDCNATEAEAASVLGQTESDGTYAFTAEQDRAYFAKATPEDGVGEAKKAFVAGLVAGLVAGNSCAEVVREENTEPVLMKVE